MPEMHEIGQEMDRVLRVTLTAAGQVVEAARRAAERERRAAVVTRERPGPSTPSCAGNVRRAAGAPPSR
jgi:hypothetical protein